MTSWVHEVLDDQQLPKHYALLRLLREPQHVNVWRHVTVLDTAYLPHGVRLAAFPQEWLERMMETHRSRSSRYELRVEPQATRGSVGLSFSIRSVSRLFESEAQLLEMLRYPTSGDADGEDEDDDAFELALMSTCLGSSTDSAPSTRTILMDAYRHGLVVAIPLTSNSSNSSSAAKQSGIEDDGASGLLGAGSTHDLTQWWLSSPLTLHCKHKTTRGVLDSVVDALPQTLREGEQIGMLLHRRKEHRLNALLTSSTHIMASGGVAEAAPQCFYLHTYCLTIQLFPKPSEGGPVVFTDNATLDQLVVSLKPSTPAQVATIVKLHYAHRCAPRDGSEWRTSKVRFIIEQSVSEDESVYKNLICDTTWDIQLKPLPNLTANAKALKVGGVSGYALFRSELHPPVPLPSEVALSKFFAHEGNAREEMKTDDAVPKASGLSRALQTSWWSNVSPVFSKLASECTPTEQDVQRAAAHITTRVELRDNISGSVLSVAPVIKTGDAKPPPRRRRFRDLRNTHMVHYGLNLQLPFQPNTHFKGALF